MPKIKIKAKAVEQKSGFEPYDGPEPNKRGFYRAVIKKFQYGLKNSGSTGFFIVAELEAAKGDPKGHAQFDGYPMFARNIITESADGSALKEGAQRNLNNLLAALGTGDDPDLVTVKDGDPTTGSVDVLKIGGKTPVGAVINIDMDFENYEGEKRPSVGGIYRFKDDAASAGKPKFVEEDEDEDDESDLMDSEDEGDEEAGEVDERAEELEGMTLPNLRKLAKELEVATTGLKKPELIEAILDAEFPEDEEDEDEDDSPAALADEDEDDEDDEEEDDDEDDEEEDEDDDEDEQAERRAELEGMNRVALKKVLSGLQPEFRVLKRHSEADLVDAILDAEFGDETPF